MASIRQEALLWGSNSSYGASFGCLRCTSPDRTNIPTGVTATTQLGPPPAASIPRPPPGPARPQAQPPGPGPCPAAGAGYVTRVPAGQAGRQRARIHGHNSSTHSTGSGHSSRATPAPRAHVWPLPASGGTHHCSANCGGSDSSCSPSPLPPNSLRGAVVTYTRIENERQPS